MLFGSMFPLGAALAGAVSLIILAFSKGVPVGAWAAAGGLTLAMSIFIVWYEWAVRRQWKIFGG